MGAYCVCHWQPTDVQKQYFVLFNMKTYDVIILTTSQSSKLGLVGHAYVINMKISFCCHTYSAHTYTTD